HALASVEQDGVGEPLTGTERPSLLECFELGVGPSVVRSDLVLGHPRKGIIPTYANGHRIAEHAAQDLARQICRCRPLCAYLLDQFPRLLGGKVTHKTVTIVLKDRTEHEAIGCLRRRLEVRKLYGLHELRSERPECPRLVAARSCGHDGAAHRIFV